MIASSRRGNRLTATSSRTTSFARLLLALALAAGGSLASLTPTSAATPATPGRVLSPVKSEIKQMRAERTSAPSSLARNARAPRNSSGASSLSSCNSSWSVVASPNGTGDNVLSGVSAVSASDMWAVGGFTTGGTSPIDKSLAEHWNGSSWSIVPTPNVGTRDNDLNAVAAVAANNVWAVGTYVNHFVQGGTTYDIDQTLIQHWTGSTWSILPSVDVVPAGYTSTSNELFGITAMAANDVWAVGDYFDPNLDMPNGAFQTLTLHFNGANWSIVPSANAASGDSVLLGASGKSSSDVWAVGYTQAHPTASNPRQTLIEHWTGAAWAIVASPNGVVGDYELNNVAALSGTDAWAVGYWRGGIGTGLRQNLIQRWNGTIWATVPSANNGMGDNALFGVAAISSTNAWAAGYSRPDAANTQARQALTEQWNGTTWSAVSTPNRGVNDNVLFGLIALTAGNLWTVGYDMTNANSAETLTENFCATPTVTGIAPTVGPTSGGTTVTITGTNFLNATGVKFGTVAAQSFTVDSDTQITAVSPAHTSGTFDITVTYPGGSTATSSADQFTYLPLYVFSPQPIAPSGSLAANSTVTVLVVAKNFDGSTVSGANIYLSFTQATGGGTAAVNGNTPTPLTAVATSFATDANGNIVITYTAPAILPTSGTDTITAQNAATSPTVTAQDSYTFDKSTTFYFAEGFTGSGFTESLTALMPTQDGTATFDYFTEQGQHAPIIRSLTHGQVLVEDVNADVGAGHQVSARVTLSGPGVVERGLHYNNGTWHGSSDKVGVNRASGRWYFAEGSTLSIFNEFLSIQNPNPYPVVVDLNYQTDISVVATRTLTVAANTRVTVVVYAGSVTPPQVTGCDPLATCGVGSGITGVSVLVSSRTLPIVAERPFYVMNYSFGYGQIRDGHDAFGSNSTSLTWNFAEGTTLNGFNEYLTLQNPGTTQANVSIKYIYDGLTKTVNLVVPPGSRRTALVFDAANLGVGRGYVGVSAQITSDQGIVVERPMYIYFNFGSGPVAGADVVVGATGLGTLFGFAAASTAAGENDYLTIQNSGNVAATITIDYYTTGNPKVTKTFMVPASTRHTVLVFANNGEGIGPGFPPFGIVVSSDQPVLVEKPTYSSNSATYGATVTTGSTPPSGF